MKGKQWNQIVRSSIGLYYNLLYERDIDANDTKVMSSLYKLNMDGGLGSKFYDLIITNSLDAAESREAQLLAQLENFCKTIDVYDFALFARKHIFARERSNVYSNTVLLRMTSLIIEGYNLGTLEFVDSKTNSVFFSKNITQMQLTTLMFLHLRSNNNRVTKGADATLANINPSRKLTTKLIDYYKSKYPTIYNTLIAEDPKTITLQLNNAISSTQFQYPASLFFEASDGRGTKSDILSTINWERESLTPDDRKYASPYMATYNYFYSNGAASYPYLRNRRLYVRDAGVEIHFNKKADDINTLSIREYHYMPTSSKDTRSEEHYLLLQYQTDTGITRRIPMNIEHQEDHTLFTLYEADLTACILTYLWLGVTDIRDVTDTEVEMIYQESLTHADFKDKKPIKEELEHDLIKIHEQMKNVLNKLKEYIAEDNIYYQTPAHWNYHYEQTPPKPDAEKSPRADALTHVGRYTRQLPCGFVASDKAKMLARRYCLDLGDNKTFVEEFDRMQSRRIDGLGEK